MISSVYGCCNVLNGLNEYYYLLLLLKTSFEICYKKVINKRIATNKSESVGGSGVKRFICNLDGLGSKPKYTNEMR